MAKKLDAESITLLIAAGVVGLFVWNVYKTTQARKQRDDLVLDVAGAIVSTNHWQGSTGDEHYVPPNNLLGAQTSGSVTSSVAPDMRKRPGATGMPFGYPAYPGINLSTLVYAGMQPLLRPTPADYDYLVRPPSEVYS